VESPALLLLWTTEKDQWRIAAWQWKCRDRGPKRELGRTNTPLPHIKVEQSQPQSLRQLNDPGDLPGGVGLPTKHEYSLEASRDRRAMLK